MDELIRTKATNDYYDDVHYQRPSGTDSTLCGLKFTGPKVKGEATCVRCRQFAAGDF